MESLKELVARVLDINKENLEDTSSPENISSWDSFNGLMLVSELENNFSVKFTMDEVLAVKNYGDIKDALRRHDVTSGIGD